MPVPRDEIESEIAAFVGSWLDGADEHYGEGWELGTFGFVFEVQFPPDEESPLGYTDVGFTCSDARSWVQAGLFRRAMISVETELDTPSEQ